jgi:beta-glucosidase-like glycosyl hydrolase
MSGKHHSLEAFEYRHLWSFALNCPVNGRTYLQETLGEDPYLTSQLGATLVRSFQHGGLDEDKYLEVIATAKHFDVHGGPESRSLDVNGNLVNTNRTRMR